MAVSSGAMPVRGYARRPALSRACGLHMRRRGSFKDENRSGTAVYTVDLLFSNSKLLGPRRRAPRCQRCPGLQRASDGSGARRPSLSGPHRRRPPTHAARCPPSTRTECRPRPGAPTARPRQRATEAPPGAPWTQMTSNCVASLSKIARHLHCSPKRQEHHFSLVACAP